MSSAPNGTLRLGFRTLKGRERCYSVLVSLASFSFKGVVVKGNDWLMKKKKREEMPSFEKLDSHIKCMYIESEGLLTRQM